MDDRHKQIRSLKLCINCLRPGHLSSQCKSDTCRTCSKRHHTLLHFRKAASSSTEQPPPLANNGEDVQERAEVIAANTMSSIAQTLLATACVRVRDAKNKYHKVRALLDSASQSSFASQRLVTRLGLPCHSTSIQVAGFNESKTDIRGFCRIEILSAHSSFAFTSKCLVTPSITGRIPSARVDTSKIALPANLNLADPNFFEPLEVDLLLGADCFWNLLLVGHINLSARGLILRNTKLGWVIAGPMHQQESRQLQCFLATGTDNQSAKFWELEEVSMERRLSSDEVACEDHFVKTTQRNAAGRFIVKLPLRTDCELGESYSGAMKRFLSLERKLERSPVVQKQYVAFMAEYRDLGHMRKIENPHMGAPHFYLPHHAVYNLNSTTTKIRVVFDGSAKTTSGISFNDQQLVGPVIQNDLFSILLRFRRHAFVATSDIAKMYRQVLIAPEQRSLQRILWRANKADPIDTYELQTVTYGTASASFLSIRCLHAIADEICGSQQLIAHIIKSDFYVDDLLTGADDVEELLSSCHGIERALAGGGFQLHKWRSNCHMLLEHFKSTAQSATLTFDTESCASTLGLLWDSAHDSFAFQIGLENHDVNTKRTMLAQLAKIFDPLGLLAPCVIIGKVLLQRLWLERLGWDDPISQELQATWTRYTANLRTLNTISIARHAFAAPHPAHIQIHGFCDASISAYGACLYIRTTTIEGNITTAMLCAKTKVAPLKSVSIPRLELCGATLLARLLRKAISAKACG